MTAKRKLRLIHWNAEEAKQHARRLEAVGWAVDARVPGDGSGLRIPKSAPPAAVVIDLSRMPSNGTAAALMYRHTASTRSIPLVFVGGEPEKVRKTRDLLPDATFTTWPRIRSALRTALASRPARPVVPPGGVMAGYSGTPLPKKLGIKPGARVALLGAPADFANTLGAVPEGARLANRLGPGTDLAIWFVPRVKTLSDGIERMAKATPPGGLWIAWPKKASGVVTDVSEPEVRRFGLAHGLVDYKICAIDGTWSGLKFAKRR